MPSLTDLRLFLLVTIGPVFLTSCNHVFPYSDGEPTDSGPGTGDLTIKDTGVDDGLTDPADDGTVNDGDLVDGGPASCSSSAICTRTPSGCWCWENPLPQGNHLHGLWGPDSDNAYYAVGDRGMALRYTFAQGAWSPTRIQLDTLEDLHGISGSADDDILIVGDEATLLRYDGTSWQQPPVGSGFHLRGVWTDGRVAFAVGTNGTILEYDTIWTTAEPMPKDLNAVWGLSSSEAYAVGNEGLIAKYDQDVLPQWKEIPNSPTQKQLTSVWGTSEQVFATGPGSGLPYVIESSSFTWKAVPQSFGSGNPEFHAIWGTDLDNVYAVGGRAYRYTGSSKPWSFLGPPPLDAHAIAGDQSTVVIAGEQGLVVTLSGTTWIPTQSDRIIEPLRDVWMTDSGKSFAVSYNGTLLTRGTGGTWDPVIGLDIGSTIYGLWGLGPNELLVVGSKIWRVTGNVPDDEHSDPQVTFHDAWGAATIFAVGNSSADGRGHIYRRDSPGGLTEVHIEPSQNLELWGVWGTTQHIYAVGDQGRVLRSATAAGDTWTVMDTDTAPGARLEDIWGDADDNLYAVGVGGVILHRDGAAWQVIGNTGTRLNAVAGNGQGDVYAVGDRGQVLQLSPTGYQPLAPVTNEDLWSLRVEGSGAVTVVGSGGTILRYTP